MQGGADPNLQDKDGWTALHHAAEIGATDISLLLMHHGADRHITATAPGGAKCRGTAMEIAQGEGFLQLASTVRGWAPQDKRLPFNDEVNYTQNLHKCSSNTNSVKVNKAAGLGRASALAALLRGKANVEGLRKDRPDLHGGVPALHHAAVKDARVLEYTKGCNAVDSCVCLCGRGPGTSSAQGSYSCMALTRTVRSTYYTTFATPMLSCDIIRL